MLNRKLPKTILSQSFYSLLFIYQCIKHMFYGTMHFAFSMLIIVWISFSKFIRGISFKISRFFNPKPIKLGPSVQDYIDLLYKNITSNLEIILNRKLSIDEQQAIANVNCVFVYRQMLRKMEFLNSKTLIGEIEREIEFCIWNKNYNYSFGDVIIDK